MKQLTLFVSFLTLLFLVPACKDDDKPFSDCFEETKESKLILTKLEGPTISLPSKISIFFKVQDINGNPVGYLKDENFVIYEKGINDECHRVVSEFEAKRKISGREQVFNHTTILVLDLSGSVLDQSLVKLQEAATSFVDAIVPDTIDPSVAMGIWWFDGEDVLHELVPVTSNAFALKQGINNIAPGISTDNSTDLFGAVIKATAEAESILDQYELDSIAAAASVVLFTDGQDRANRYPRQQALDAVTAASKDITFFTIGVGNEINVSDLQKIGKSGYSQAASVSQLTAVFKSVASLVSNEANSYYLFEYCSPIRSGSNNGLIIEAFDLSTNESGFLKETFDATGFGGGCQL